MTGKVPEWSIGAVSKTVVRFAYRGFESLPFRKIELNELKINSLSSIFDIYWDDIGTVILHSTSARHSFNPLNIKILIMIPAICFREDYGTYNHKSNLTDLLLNSITT